MSDLTPGVVTYILYPELVDGTVDEARTALTELGRFATLSVWEIPYRTDIYDDDVVRGLLEGRELMLGTQTSFIKRGWNLSALDDESWREAVDHLRSAIALAGDLGAPWVALWAGEDTASEPASASRLVEAIGQVKDQAERAGVRLLLEAFPTCSFGGSVVPDLATAVDVCKKSGGAIGIMFDPAHHTLVGDTLPPASWECVDYVQLASGGLTPDGKPVDSHPFFGAENAISNWSDMLTLTRDAQRHGYAGPAVFEVRDESDRLAMLSRLDDLGRELTGASA
ncbi:sugar phosphate isomerase/epimerase family protein [Mycobacterium sp. SMC-4]|uniref:sugar phosphate isomerase/epimerase family protein n=1 Tax=Mycobacterium sp. SMC-4 TaxID=2857059 RepID=UPI003D028CE6